MTDGPANVENKTRSPQSMRTRVGFLKRPIPAEPLALCRMVTAITILWSSFVSVGPDLFRDSSLETMFSIDMTAMVALTPLWIVSLLLVTVGLHTRLATFVAWLFALSLWFNINDGGDDDITTQILVVTLLLFNLMIAPVGAAWSVDRLRKLLAAYHDPDVGFELPTRKIEIPPPRIASWSVRLMQIQLCGTMLLVREVGAAGLYFLCFLPLLLSAESVCQIAKRVAHRTSGGMFQVYYDTFCPICRRSRLALESLDIGKRLNFRDIHDRKKMQHDLPEVSYTRALREMIVQTPSGRVVGGFDAVRAIGRALPAIWPVLPLMYLPGVAIIGRKIYHWIARRRYKIVQCDNGICSLHLAALAGSDLNEEEVARIVERAKTSPSNVNDA